MLYLDTEGRCYCGQLPKLDQRIMLTVRVQPDGQHTYRISMRARMPRHTKTFSKKRIRFPISLPSFLPQTEGKRGELTANVTAPFRFRLERVQHSTQAGYCQFSPFPSPGAAIPVSGPYCIMRGGKIPEETEGFPAE